MSIFRILSVACEAVHYRKIKVPFGKQTIKAPKSIFQVKTNFIPIFSQHSSAYLGFLTNT